MKRKIALWMAAVMAITSIDSNLLLVNASEEPSVEIQSEETTDEATDEATAETTDETEDLFEDIPLFQSAEEDVVFEEETDLILDSADMIETYDQIEDEEYDIYWDMEYSNNTCTILPGEEKEITVTIESLVDNDISDIILGDLEPFSDYEEFHVEAGEQWPVVLDDSGVVCQQKRTYSVSFLPKDRDQFQTEDEYQMYMDTIMKQYVYYSVYAYHAQGSSDPISDSLLYCYTDDRYYEIWSEPTDLELPFGTEVTYAPSLNGYDGEEWKQIHDVSWGFEWNKNELEITDATGKTLTYNNSDLNTMILGEAPFTLKRLSPQEIEFTISAYDQTKGTWFTDSKYRFEELGYTINLDFYDETGTSRTDMYDGDILDGVLDLSDIEAILPESYTVKWSALYTNEENEMIPFDALPGHIDGNTLHVTAEALRQLLESEKEANNYNLAIKVQILNGESVLAEVQRDLYYCESYYDEYLYIDDEISFLLSDEMRFADNFEIYILDKDHPYGDYEFGQITDIEIQTTEGNPDKLFDIAHSNGFWMVTPNDISEGSITFTYTGYEGTIKKKTSLFHVYAENIETFYMIDNDNPDITLGDEKKVSVHAKGSEYDYELDYIVPMDMTDIIIGDDVTFDSIFASCMEVIPDEMEYVTDDDGRCIEVSRTFTVKTYCPDPDMFEDPEEYEELLYILDQEDFYPLEIPIYKKDNTKDRIDSCKVSLWFCNDYYELTLSGSENLKSLPIGDTQVLTPVLRYKISGEEVKDVTSEYIYRIVMDDQDAFEFTSIDGKELQTDEDGNMIVRDGSFMVKRNKEYSYYCEIEAGYCEEDQFFTKARNNIYFDYSNRNVDMIFPESYDDIAGIIYPGEKQMITLDTTDIKEAGYDLRDDYHVKWYSEIYVSNGDDEWIPSDVVPGTADGEVFYADGDKVKQLLESGLFGTDTNLCYLRADICLGDTVVTTAYGTLTLREPSLGEISNLELFLNEEIEIDEYMYTDVYDKHNPEGEGYYVTIKSIEIMDPSIAAIEKADDCYVLTGNGVGETKAFVTYYVEDEDYEGTTTFDISVIEKKVALVFDYLNGTGYVIPGEKATVEASVFISEMKDGILYEDRITCPVTFDLDEEYVESSIVEDNKITFVASEKGIESVITCYVTAEVPGMNDEISDYFYIYIENDYYIMNQSAFSKTEMLVGESQLVEAKLIHRTYQKKDVVEKDSSFEVYYDPTDFKVTKVKSENGIETYKITRLTFDETGITFEGYLNDENEDTEYIGSAQLYLKEQKKVELKTPSAPKVSCKTNGMQISWNATPGAAYYKIYRNGKVIKTINEPQAGTYLDKGAKKNGSVYKYSIKAFAYKENTGGRKEAKSATTTSYFVSLPSVSVSHANSKQIQLKWKRNTKASGYVIQYSKDKDFKKGVKTVTIKKNSTLKKLISASKSYKWNFRFKAYKTVKGKKYYSAVKTILNK